MLVGREREEDCDSLVNFGTHAKLRITSNLGNFAAEKRRR
jgi:hypothetical protein